MLLLARDSISSPELLARCCSSTTSRPPDQGRRSSGCWRAAPVLLIAGHRVATSKFRPTVWIGSPLAGHLRLYESKDAELFFLSLRDEHCGRLGGRNQTFSHLYYYYVVLTSR